MGRGNKRNDGDNRGSQKNFGGGFRSNFSSFGDSREMHKAICADCGNSCEVPFKPIEGKPVYCRDCYQKHRKY